MCQTLAFIWTCVLPNFQPMSLHKQYFQTYQKEFPLPPSREHFRKNRKVQVEKHLETVAFVFTVKFLTLDLKSMFRFPERYTQEPNLCSYQQH